MTNKHVYLEVTFGDEVKSYFNKLISELVMEEYFYYSDDVEHIQGNVTDSIHLTLFFGLKAKEINNPELIKLVQNTTITDIFLDSIILTEGYKNLYKILIVNVDDRSNKLYKVSQEMLNFDYDQEAIHEKFKPHLTLAYVKPSFSFTNIQIQLVNAVKAGRLNLNITH